MEEKKKNGVIVVTIILAIIVLAVGGYLVYEKVLNKPIPEENKVNDNTENKPIEKERNTIVDNDDDGEEYVVASKGKTVDEVYAEMIAKIKEVKNNQELDDLRKALKISKIVASDYYSILGSSKVFECSENDTSYDCNDYTFGFQFNKDLTTVTSYSSGIMCLEDNPVLVDDNYGECNNLKGFINWYEKIAYYEKFIQTNNFEIDYDYVRKEYDLTEENACIGYTNEKDYLYIDVNKVSIPKLGWYALDKTTGECGGLIETVARYKIDKNTLEYEIIKN